MLMKHNRLGFLHLKILTHLNSYNTCSDLHNFLYFHIAKEFHGFTIHKPSLMKNPAMDERCRKLIFPAIIDKMHLNPSLLLC